MTIGHMSFEDKRWNIAETRARREKPIFEFTILPNHSTQKNGALPLEKRGIGFSLIGHLFIYCPLIHANSKEVWEEEEEYFF